MLGHSECRAQRLCPSSSLCLAGMQFSSLPTIHTSLLFPPDTRSCSLGRASAMVLCCSSLAPSTGTLGGVLSLPRGHPHPPTLKVQTGASGPLCHPDGHYHQHHHLQLKQPSLHWSFLPLHPPPRIFLPQKPTGITPSFLQVSAQMVSLSEVSSTTPSHVPYPT